MPVDALLQIIYDLPLSQMIREGSLLFPLIETVHVIAIAAVLGTVLIVDLRLLGVATYTRSIAALSRDLLPITWGAFVIAVLAGTLMFISNALTYFHSDNFRAKFACMALAGVNMAVFHLVTQKTMGAWDRDEVPPVAGRIAGLLSILLWASVVFWGRRVGFFLVDFGRQA